MANPASIIQRGTSLPTDNNPNTAGRLFFMESGGSLTSLYRDNGTSWQLANLSGSTITNGYYYADAYSSLQAAIDAANADGGGTVFLSAKTYSQANIILYSRVQLVGAGIGRTKIQGTDSTKAVIEVTGTTYNFVSISNLTVIGSNTGSNNHGIYTHSVTDELYFARFDQLEIKDCGGKGIYIDALFSCHFNYVFVTNCGDNLFDIMGGNTVALYNCYADDVAANKTGYRIHRGQIVLINCNGIDSLGSNTNWAIFGDKTSEDGVDAYVDATLIGCNIENFKLYGVRCKEGSRAEYYSTFFTASASGSSHVAILHDYTADNPGVLSSTCRFNTNGGSWANSLPIHTKNDIPLLPLGHNNQTQYYNDTGAVAVDFVGIDVAVVGSSRYVSLGKGAMNELAFPTDNTGDIGPNENYRPRDINAGRYSRAGSYFIGVDGLISKFFNNTASAAPTISNRRGRGSLGSQVAIQSGDVLGYIDFQGQYDTTDTHMNASAFMTVSATENFDATHGGTKITLTAAQNGSTNGFSRGFTLNPTDSSLEPISTGSLSLGSSTVKWASAYINNLLITTFAYINNLVALSQSGSVLEVGLGYTSNGVKIYGGGSNEIRIDGNGNVRLGATGGMSTSATDGFPYIRSGAGAPTGVPTALTGMVPLYYDTSNNKLYVYNGAWKQVTLT